MAVAAGPNTVRPDMSVETSPNDDDIQSKQQTGDQNRTGMQQSKDEPVNKPFHSAADSTLSKRAQRKLLHKQKLKEMKKAKQASKDTKNSSPGFSSDIFHETDYYFENGLRKVYPYPFTFSTHAKERWYSRTIKDIFENEFRIDSSDSFRSSVAKGKMRVNGKVVSLDYCVKNGDLIEHEIHRHENPVSGKAIEIIADTPELVVINKPASIPCHPCGKFRYNSIVFIMGKEFGYANLRNIYRLDRLTSGVLIMGKTARKTKELENQVLHRHVYKEYIAKVLGEFPENEVVVNQPLGCLSHKLTLWQVQAGGKPSRTTFQRISYNGKTSVVRCMPHTGRTHQIRVHLQYLGHPILNDPYYNSPSWGPLRGKGGHCDVSHEELCQRIMKEHNVGLWYDGENPLFSEASSTSVENTNEVHPRSKETGTTETYVEVNASQQPDQSELLSPPQPKRPRLTIEETEPASDGNVCTYDVDDVPRSSPGATTVNSCASAKDTISEVCSSRDCSMPFNSDSDASDKGNRESKDKDCEDIAMDKGNRESEDKDCEDIAMDKGNRESKDKDCEDIAMDKGNRESEDKDCEDIAMSEAHSLTDSTKVEKEFDLKRWVPDPLCEKCRLKYIDPQPHDLVLYLHAIKYKGPTWEYSTDMPAWASEDWEEPEEYRKYFT